MVITLTKGSNSVLPVVRQPDIIYSLTACSKKHCNIYARSVEPKSKHEGIIHKFRMWDILQDKFPGLFKKESMSWKTKARELF